MASASTAYLITKISDPPPTPSSGESVGWVDGQIEWRAKRRFLGLGVRRLDAENVEGSEEGENPTVVADGGREKGE